MNTVSMKPNRYGDGTVSALIWVRGLNPAGSGWELCHLETHESSPDIYSVVHAMAMDDSDEGYIYQYENAPVVVLPEETFNVNGIAYRFIPGNKITEGPKLQALKITPV